MIRTSVALIVFVFGIVSSAFADSGQKIAIIDVQKALANSDSGKAAQAAYKGEVQKAQASIDAKKEEYQKRMEAFQKQEKSLSDSARDEKKEELSTLEKDLKRMFQDSQDSLRKKNEQLVGDIVKDLRAVVEQVGKDEGYTLILDRSSQVLFADTSVDITDKVVERLNKKK